MPKTGTRNLFRLTFFVQLSFSVAHKYDIGVNFAH